MSKFKIGTFALLGLVLFVNTAAYFSASSLLYGVQWQQLAQIKHLMWIAIAVYIAGQVKDV